MVTSRVATAHVINPCAVSRKKTSCVCAPTHFVRNRPVMDPPRAAESHCMIRRAIAETTVIAFADAPAPDQGDMDARSTPVATSASTIEVAAATTAPARIAAQDTADVLDSVA